MSEPKTNCSSCGCEILQRTADRNGGLCAPCHRKGPLPQVAADPTDWTWPIIGGIGVLCFLIGWIGWTTFVAITLWIVFLGALAAGIGFTVVACQAEQKQDQSDAWGIAGVGSVVAILSCLFLIYWITWTTFITIVLWIVIPAAVIAAIVLAVLATQAENDDEKIGGWVFAGGSLVVAVVAWFLIPSASPTPDKVQSAGTATESKSYSGLTKDQLKLVAHTVYGSWSEEDWLGNQTQQWNGSAGVITKESGKLYLVSNSHCLGLAELRQSDALTDDVPDIRSYKLEIEFASGRRKPVLRFGDQDGALDLSLLEVDASGLVDGVDYVVLPYSDGRRFTEGDEVVAVGSPLGLAGTQTYGRISALREQLRPQRHRLIQTDAAINPGNSGGPLLVKSDDGQYHWIGINTSKIGGADNLGFAIDARDAMNTKYRWFSANAYGAGQAIRTLYTR